MVEDWSLHFPILWALGHKLLSIQTEMASFSVNTSNSKIPLIRCSSTAVGIWQHILWRISKSSLEAIPSPRKNHLFLNSLTFTAKPPTNYLCLGISPSKHWSSTCWRKSEWLLWSGRSRASKTTAVTPLTRAQPETFHPYSGNTPPWTRQSHHHQGQKQPLKACR